MAFDPDQTMSNLFGDTASEGIGATHAPGVDAVCRPLFNSASGAAPSIAPSVNAKMDMGQP